MIYSCFNQKTGLYEYFQDPAAHPTNGDLPVPSLPSSAGRVGVPAMEAGRSLPSGAKRAGQGLTARGLIVQCQPSYAPGLQGLGLGESFQRHPVLWLAGAAVVAYVGFRLYVGAMQEPWGSV